MSAPQGEWFGAGSLGPKEKGYGNLQGERPVSHKAKKNLAMKPAGRYSEFLLKVGRH